MDSNKVLGRRFVALILDSLILSAINLAIYFPLAEKEADVVAELEPGESVSTFVNIGDYTLTGGKAGLYMLGALVITLLYWVVLVGRTGWSPGKLAVGIRVVRSDTGSTPPGMLKAFLRWFLLLADAFPYLIPYLTGWIVAMTNPRRRRIGDLAAGTEVVKASAVGQPSQPAAGSAPAAEAAPPVMGTQAMPAITPASAPEPPPLPQAASGPAADWYPDPHGEKRLRYWDGSQWTDHTAD